MNTQIDISSLLAEPMVTLFERTFDLGEVLTAVLIALIVLALLLIVLSWRKAKARAVNEAATLERAREAEARMAELVASQNELTRTEEWWKEHPRMCCTINKIAPLDPIVAQHKV